MRKKDGSLRFCIDFRRLNARTKKDTYPLPRMQETMESMVGTRHFSCMDLKSGFWQAQMDEESRQYTAFTVGSIAYALRVMQCSSDIPASHAKLLRRAEPHVCPNILGRRDRLLQDRRRTLGASPRHVGAIHGARFEIEAVQM